MIAELLLDFLFALVNGVIDLLPSGDPPNWMTDGSSMLADVWAQAAGLGAWVPWNLVGTVFAAVLSCMSIGLVIKLVRIVASFFTAGGGSAA